MVNNRLFIAYCPADEAWLQKLLVHLAPMRRQGQIELLGPVLIQSGDVEHHKLAEHVAQAHMALALLSANTLACDHTWQHQLQPLLARQRKQLPLHWTQLAPFDGENNPINTTPIRHPDTPLSALSEDQQDAALAEITRFLKSQLELASAAPASPAEPVPLEPPGLPAIHHFPMAYNPLFVGRAEDLLAVAASLRKAQTTVIGQALAVKGMGGIGKTQLAVAYAYSYGQHYPGGVFWLNFERASSIADEVMLCGPSLGLYSLDDRISPDEKVRVVRAVWDGPGAPCLLIFDNCEDPQLLRDWLPKGRQHHTLLTSRRQNWPKDLPLAEHALKLLSRPQSMELLQRLGANLTPTEADSIAACLGDLPLALHLAGCFLANYGDELGPAAYLTALQSNPLQHASMAAWDDECLPTGHDNHVARTFAVSLNRLSHDNEHDQQARQLLAHAAWFAPGETILKAHLLASVKDWEPLLASKALNRLLSLGLLSNDPEGLQLHRLIASFAKDSLHANQLQAAETAVAAAVDDLADEVNGSGLPKQMAPLLAHLRFHTERYFQQESALAAGLCTNLAAYLDMIADYQGAVKYARQALTLAEKVLGPNHPATALCLNNLAWHLHASNRLAEAEPLYRRALSIDEAALGPDHPNVAIRLSNLANLLRDSNRQEEAEPLYRRALSIGEAALGPEHPDVAIDLNNLATLLRASNRQEEAEPLYRRALSIDEAALGPDHPQVAIYLNNLAVLLHGKGEKQEALACMRRAYDIRMASLGPDHPYTIGSAEWLALWEL